MRYKYRVGSSDPVVRVRVSHPLSWSAIPQPSRSKRLMSFITRVLSTMSRFGMRSPNSLFSHFSGSIFVLFDLRRTRQACAYLPKGSLVILYDFSPICFASLVFLQQLYCSQYIERSKNMPYGKRQTSRTKACSYLQSILEENQYPPHLVRINSRSVQVILVVV